MYLPLPVSRPSAFNFSLITATLLATAAAATLAYGTDAYWAQFRRGFSIILFTHRLQWVLATISLLLCLAVMGLIIGGRRRAWWLMALGPVLALFVHRIVSNPMRQFEILEDPLLAKAVEVSGTTLKDDDWVVGVQFGDQAYAYPYAALFRSPVILQNNHEQRMLLIWSPFANRATAFKVDREIRKSELQIVAMPCNTLLLYNGRNGQLINGVTGQTTGRDKPIGLHQSVETRKMTWQSWRKLHPDSLVLVPIPGDIPTAPILPRYPMPPPGAGHAPEAMVIFAATTRPVAIPADSINDQPSSVSAGETQLLLFRDKTSGVLRAFDRRVHEDLFPQFRPKTDPKRPTVAFIDKDSGTEWSADGKAIEGPFKGEQLRPIAADDGVYWGVIHYWYPAVKWITPTQATTDPSVSNPKEPRRRTRPAR